MCRNSFSYSTFVKAIVDNNDVAVMPSGMVRESIKAGATESGDLLRKRLRESCDSLASQNGYKRIKEKGVRGFLYCRSGVA
jgi:hypothetical protein